MIGEQFVSFDTAELLKEAGFEANLKTRYVEEEKDEWAFWDSGTKRSDYNYFDDTIACPTQALAARWLREVHGIHVYAIQTNLPYTEPQTTKWEWGYVIGKIDDPNSNIATCEMYFGSYEDAFEAGVAKCLELIKK